MKQRYKDWNPRPQTLELVEQSDLILSEFSDDGYTCTLRQLYYQFVAMGEDAMSNLGFRLDKKTNSTHNHDGSYDRIGSVMTKARMAGLIDWNHLEDRGRHCSRWSFDEDELEAIDALPGYICFDFWERQPFYIEVWVEKDALGNVIERACNPFRVPHMACKGYLSASASRKAGVRFQQQLHNDKECVLIHLGDHDPSGIDMTRDNNDRIDTFSELPGDVNVNRIALNMDQVEKFDLPPNPTKMKDSRSDKYIELFGHTSWELDALKHRFLENLIKEEISSYIDQDIWNEVREMEKEKRDLLTRLGENWDEIKKMI